MFISKQRGNFSVLMLSVCLVTFLCVINTEFSTGLVVLKQLEIDIEVYYASEIDENANKVRKSKLAQSLILLDLLIILHFD